MFKRRFRFHFRQPIWWFRLKQTASAILLPLLIFQLIRTILLPTSFDVMLSLLFLLLLAFSKWSPS